MNANESTEKDEDETVDKIPLVAKDNVAKIGPFSRFLANLKYFVFGTGE